MINLKNIKKESWKDILLGLQEYFNLTQFELLDKINIKRTSQISNWISGKVLPSKYIRLKFIEFILKNNLEISKMTKLGKNVRNSIKFEENIYSIKNAVEWDYFENKLILNRNNKKYLNIPLIFPKRRNNEPIKFILLNKQILVFYKYKFTNNLKVLLLPKFLELNEDFLVGLGIYVAEGAKNRHPKITNSEPLIIDQAIKFFKLFNFKDLDLKAWIQLHERSSKSLEESKKFWIKNTNLNIDNITKLRIKKSRGNAKVKQFGTLHLEINSILFQLFINNLLKYIPEIIKTCNKQQLIWFLQGLYAGEGSVNLSKSKSLNMIIYTSKIKNERKMVMELLSQLDINSKHYPLRYDVRIMGYENLKKTISLDLFKYHLLRKEKMEKGFKTLENNKIPGLNKSKIINLLNQNGVLSTNNVCNNFNLHKRCILKHLNELYKIGTIKKINGSGPIQHRWSV